MPISCPAKTHSNKYKLADYHNTAWRSGSALVSINEVNLRRARLVLGWVTASGFNSRCGMFISVCSLPPRSTQPGHPFVGRRNALRLGSKGRYGSCVGGRKKLCDPLVTHGSYLSTLETWHNKALNKFTFFTLLLLF